MSNENKLYGESEMIKAARYGYEYHQDSQFPSLKFDEMAVNNFKQLLLSNKLQEEEISVKHFHMGDIMTNDLELDYPNYYVRIEDYQTLQSTLTTVTAERDMMREIFMKIKSLDRSDNLNSAEQDFCSIMVMTYAAISQSEKGENGNG